MSNPQEISIVSADIKVIYPIQKRINTDSKRTDTNYKANCEGEPLGKLKSYLHCFKPDNHSAECPHKNNTLRGSCEACIVLDAGWGWWTYTYSSDSTNLKEVHGFSIDIEEKVDKWVQDRHNEPTKDSCYPLVRTGNSAEESKDKKSHQDEEYRYVAFGPETAEHVPSPYFIIECVVPQNEIEEIKKGDRNWNTLIMVLYRTLTTDKFLKNKDMKAKDEQDKEESPENFAYGNNWMCFFTGRSLLILHSKNSDKKIKESIKELITFTEQAVSFIWSMTVALNGISHSLDNWLKTAVIKVESMVNDKNDGAGRVEILKEILKTSSELRRQYALLLMDPTAYAFPAGTIHEVLEKARDEFGTEKAREYLLKKFEVVDRVLEDMLQVSALNH